MFREEELLSRVAPLPVLSTGLRSRVLAAAGEARARRSRARQFLVRSLVLLGILGPLAWHTPYAPTTQQGAMNGSMPGDAQDAGAPADSSPYCRSEMCIAAMGDEWKMVEAEFRAREEFVRRTQM